MGWWEVILLDVLAVYAAAAWVLVWALRKGVAALLGGRRSGDAAERSARSQQRTVKRD